MGCCCLAVPRCWQALPCWLLCVCSAVYTALHAVRCHIMSVHSPTICILWHDYHVLLKQKHVPILPKGKQKPPTYRPTKTCVQIPSQNVSHYPTKLIRAQLFTAPATLCFELLWLCKLFCCAVALLVCRRKCQGLSRLSGVFVKQVGPLGAPRPPKVLNLQGCGATKNEW